MQGQLGSQSLHPRLQPVQLYDDHTVGSAKRLMHVPAKALRIGFKHRAGARLSSWLSRTMLPNTPCINLMHNLMYMHFCLT